MALYNAGGEALSHRILVKLTKEEKPFLGLAVPEIRNLDLMSGAFGEGIPFVG